MAVAYSAVATNSTTGSTTLTATFGAAPASDAVLVAFVVGRGGTARTFTADTGTWTSINRTDQGTTVAMETFWRLGDGSTTAFQFGNDSSSEDWQVAVLSITGANTTTPIGGTAENNATTGTGVTVTLTPTHASSGTPSLIAQGWGNTGNHTWTPDASATERWDFKSNTFSNTSSGGGHDTSNATSTSDISRTWTASGSGANVAQMIEIRGADNGVSVTPAAATLNLSAPNPTVALGSTSVTPAAGRLNLSAVNPTVTLGSVTVTPAAAVLNLSAPNPTVTLGGVSVTPAAATVQLSAPNPTVTLGAVAVAPAAAVLNLSAVDPSVTVGGGGGTVVTPAAAVLTLSAPDPTVTLGSTSVVPAAATVQVSAVSPTVVLGSVGVAPGAAVLTLGAVSPTVTLGATAVTPAAAILTLSAPNPTVLIESATATVRPFTSTSVVGAAPTSTSARTAPTSTSARTAPTSTSALV